VAVGDALGVAVEFRSRATISACPVTNMIGYGTYNMPPGTWSDDSSMTFCLGEALTEKDFNLNSIAKNFLKWTNEAYWTAGGVVFDIGNTTIRSIRSLESGVEPQNVGGKEYVDNGNGSLMRIAPLLFHIYDKRYNERFNTIKDVSSITHGHDISIVSCYYYLEFLREIKKGAMDKISIYHFLKTKIKSHLLEAYISEKDIMKFDRLLEGNIYECPEEEIRSTGYVLDSLEASIWCLLTTKSYSDAVLKAVNLGDDTDTTAAITGALAGLLYGYDNIPEEWINTIARKEDIEDLANRIYNNLNKNKK
jgi:ADP-ribosylglycohydrolase